MSIISDSTPPTPRASLDLLVHGYRIAQGLYVATKLAIPDLLADGSRDCADLAAVTDTDASSLYRLLRMLASVGVFVEDEQQRFGLTPTAELLRSDVPGTLQPMLLHVLGEENWKAWGELKYSVRTGKPAFDHVHGEDYFAYLGQRPEMNVSFNAFMTAQTRHNARAVVTAYDFSGIRTLVDVGGGHGTMLATALAANPTLQGVLFDAPHVVSGAQAIVDAAHVTERCKLVGGDFFAAVPPGGDAYLLQQILHDWDDDRALRILQRCREAIATSARLLVVERLIPPGNGLARSKFTDMNMMVILGGKERSESEYARLYSAAGFRFVRVVPTASEFFVIEGVSQ